MPMPSPASIEFQTVMEQAMEAARHDAYAEADALIDRAIRLAPGSGLPYYLRATNQAEVGLHDLAEANFTACLNRAPGFSIARFQLGLLQYTMAREALAVATWEPLMGLADDHALKLYVQALVCLMSKDGAGAARLLERGLAALPCNPALNNDMARLLERVRDSANGSTSDTPDPVHAAHFLIGAYRMH